MFSKEIIEMALSYGGWSHKGVEFEGRRISINTPSGQVPKGQEFHVVHVLETTGPDLDTYVKGPKVVYGEYINGKLVSEELPEGEHPFSPQEHAEYALTGPCTDFNFHNTTYSFDEAGRYEIVWMHGELKSNVLVVEVLD